MEWKHHPSPCTHTDTKIQDCLFWKNVFLHIWRMMPKQVSLLIIYRFTSLEEVVLIIMVKQLLTKLSPAKKPLPQPQHTATDTCNPNYVASPTSHHQLCILSKSLLYKQWSHGGLLPFFLPYLNVSSQGRRLKIFRMLGFGWQLLFYAITCC